MVRLCDRPWSRAELLARAGRYTGLPARLAGYGTTWHGDDRVLWAEGEVVQAALSGVQLALRRRVEAFPRHITWRRPGMGSYVVAMEPSTNRVSGRLDARAPGELQYPTPGEERRYTLEIGLSGMEQIDRVAGRARQLAGMAPAEAR